MEAREIEFRFKGERNYIHGTDMFNAMVAVCPRASLRNIRFAVHSFVRTPWCRMYLTDSKDALREIGEISARCQFYAEGTPKWLALQSEGGDTSTGGRYVYDEGVIAVACRTESDGIVLEKPSPFTFIETVVAMNKRMHEQLFPDARGKWIFTRIDLDVLCDAHEHLSLRLRHNLNLRLTKSDVLISGEKVGDIYFSLVKS